MQATACAVAIGNNPGRAAHAAPDAERYRSAAQQRAAAVDGADGFACFSVGMAPPRLTSGVRRQERPWEH